MSARSFIRHRRPLRHEGRRYVVRGPTYATVWALVAAYPVEVAGMAAAHLAHPGAVTVESALGLLVPARGDRRAVDVLTTCVETEADPATWPLRTLALAMLGLCDLGAIIAHVGIERLAAIAEAEGTTARAEGGPDEDGRDGATAILEIARLFGCSPMDVMDWPYEAVMVALDVLPDMLGRGGEPEDGSGHSPEFMRMLREMARKPPTKPEA